jgi:hypothetical protein
MREKNVPMVDERFHTITNRDCGKKSTMAVELTIQHMPKTSHEKTCDHVEKSMLAANHLKILAGDTRNMNESKINLDS